MQSPLIAIIGPTASGKTDLAIYLAQQTHGAVASADSRQVYAALNIGTAKPEQAWQAQPHTLLQPDTIDSVDHFLLNVASPVEPYTLATWQSAAFEVIAHLHQKNAAPYLVGGTMLYVDSVLDNFSLPQVPPNPLLRETLAERTAPDLYQELITKDPASKQFIEPHHAQRIIRALEVIAATGRPFSELRKKHPSRYRLHIIGLFPGWEELEKSIRQRANSMLKEGLLEEMRGLQEQFTPQLPLLSTMNYREVGDIISGAATPKEALEAMVRSNMKYARRQMNWWKNRKNIVWYTPASRTAISQAVTEFLSGADQ